MRKRMYTNATRIHTAFAVMALPCTLLGCGQTDAGDEHVRSAPSTEQSAIDAISPWLAFAAKAEERLSEAESRLAKPDNDDMKAWSDGDLDVWEELMREGHDAIWNIVVAGDASTMRALVGRFTESDAPAERLLLMISAQHLTLPLHREYLGHPHKPTAEFPLTADVVEAKFGIFAEQMVRLLVSDDDALADYCQIVQWHRRLVMPERPDSFNMAIETTADGLTTARTPTRKWWYTRNALLLLALAGETGRLEDNDEDDLASRIQQAFNAWVADADAADLEWQFDTDKMRWTYPLLDVPLVGTRRPDPAPAVALRPLPGLRMWPPWRFVYDYWYNEIPY